jgi:hypothetical protein
MQLLNASFNINGKCVRISNAGQDRILVEWFPTDGEYHRPKTEQFDLGDADENYMVANKIMLPMCGGRKNRPEWANATNSEICKMADYVEMIGSTYEL